jgi:hypothetical protein
VAAAVEREQVVIQQELKARFEAGMQGVVALGSFEIVQDHGGSLRENFNLWFG